VVKRSFRVKRKRAEHMLKRMLIIILSIILSMIFYSPASALNSDLLVSAAMSLKNTFEEIGKLYEQKYPGVKVSFNFGASGTLQKQIESGAPVDIFASASLKEMDELESKNYILKGTRRNFAGNSLIVIVPANPKVQVRSFDDLAGPAVKGIATGNPKSVPAGKYSEEALRSLHLFERLKEKLVYAENVRQVMDYVSRGEVDAGIVFYSDAFSRSKGFKIAARIPGGSHEQIKYPIAVIRGTRNDSLANAFILTVISEKGKEVLRKNGFTSIP
jgi:molybdate transport system substrate-binding protein